MQQNSVIAIVYLHAKEMNFNLYVIVSDGQFVQIEDCKCYPAGYRCEPHTERVPNCRWDTRDRHVLCCRIRDTKDKGNIRRQQLTHEHNEARKAKMRVKKNKPRSRKIHDVRDFVNMFIHRRLGK